MATQDFECVYRQRSPDDDVTNAIIQRHIIICQSDAKPNTRTEVWRRMSGNYGGHHTLYSCLLWVKMLLVGQSYHVLPLLPYRHATYYHHHHVMWCKCVNFVQVQRWSVWRR